MSKTINTGTSILSLLLMLVTAQPASAKEYPLDKSSVNGTRMINQTEDRAAPPVYTPPPERENTKPTIPQELSVTTFSEQMDNFFLNAPLSELVKVTVSKETDSEEIDTASQGDVIKVHANFDMSYPEGTYIFYIRPDTGAYENAMIAKGRLSGTNKLSGLYASFYIPRLGQITGTAKIFVYVPGQGVGSTSINILHKE